MWQQLFFVLTVSSLALVADSSNSMLASVLCQYNFAQKKVGSCIVNMAYKFVIGLSSNVGRGALFPFLRYKFLFGCSMEHLALEK